MSNVVGMDGRPVAASPVTEQEPPLWLTLHRSGVQRICDVAGSVAPGSTVTAEQCQMAMVSTAIASTEMQAALVELAMTQASCLLRIASAMERLIR